MNARDYSLPEKKQDRIYGSAAVIGTGIVLTVTLLLPLGFDNDLYESMGWALYAYHGLPYLGSWDHNFPGIIFIHWASIVLFGASDFGFRLFDYFVHLATAALYYRVLRHWLTPRASFIGVILYALYYASGLWGLAGQRDTYASLFLLGAVELFIGARDRLHGTSIRSTTIGILCGAAFLMRPTYVFFAMAFLILFWMERASVKTIVFYLLGSILPILGFLLPYVFVSNGPDQVYRSIIRFNLDVYSSVTVPVNVISNGRAPIYVFAVFGIIFAIARQGLAKGSRDRWLFVLLAASALLSPIVMGKYFSYHLELCLVIAIGFAALGFDALLQFVPFRAIQAALIAMAFAVFVYAYYPRQLFRYYYEAAKTSSTPIEATYERVLSDSLFGLARQNQVIQYVNQISPPNQPVEYISIFPSLRWRMQRPAPTRFTSIVPLSAYRNKIPEFGAAWQKEFIDSLKNDPPRVMIVSRSQMWWPFVGKTNDSAIRAIPGFDSLLAANYVPDSVIGGYAIYRSKK